MIIKQNQSAFDFATQISGDVKAVLDFCLANELSITDEIQAGTDSNDYITTYKNEIVIDYFQAKETELATGNIKAEAEPLGIGTMIIGTNFDIL